VADATATITLNRPEVLIVAVRGYCLGQACERAGFVASTES
jgi:enoyl-CoA hydratase/carnithine racemase